MSATIRLILVWGATLALLAATIAATVLPLGPVRPLVSYGIATAKAMLILWFFMELRREGGLARLATLAAFAWLMILFALITADYVSRG